MPQKYVLVTGSSRGIGKSIALKFASEGWHVFLNCRYRMDALQNVKEEIEASTPGSCELLPGDVSSPADVAHIFRKIHASCGCLDVLVNNAGISHIGLLMDMTDEDWDKVLSSNLSSVFYCCRAAIPPMLSHGSGRIINISSMWGVNGASCEAAYSASKAGVGGLTQALAKELARSKIPVNALACGVIDTEMNKQLDEAERAELAEDIPAGRFATPEEVAEMVWELICAPEYLTGQIITFDGGYL
mgnify:FL=1